MGLLTERLLIALSDRGSETCKHQCSIGNVLRDDVTHEIVASELSRSPSARASSGSGESSGNSRAGVARDSGFGASVLRPVRAMSCLTERASLSGTICIVTIASMPDASASAIWSIVSARTGIPLPRQTSQTSRRAEDPMLQPKAAPRISRSNLPVCSAFSAPASLATQTATIPDLARLFRRSFALCGSPRRREQPAWSGTQAREYPTPVAARPARREQACAPFLGTAASAGF